METNTSLEIAGYSSQHLIDIIRKIQRHALSIFEVVGFVSE